jgi:hypothetical protein
MEHRWVFESTAFRRQQESSIAGSDPRLFGKANALIRVSSVFNPWPMERCLGGNPQRTSTLLV